MQSKWTFKVKVARFSVLLFAQTTVHISWVQLNRFLSHLSLPTGSLLFLSLLHSGIVAVVTTTLQTKMQKDDLVTGMTFASSEKPDVVCEPCLAGKMRSNPFPSSPSCSTQPFELIHSDLHGLLPVPTREGYRYWITFIDDATSYCAAMKLKRKSDAFDAFKMFKSFTENLGNQQRAFHHLH